MPSALYKKFGIYIATHFFAGSRPTNFVDVWFSQYHTVHCLQLTSGAKALKQCANTVIEIYDAIQILNPNSI
jgi:hypothetical protein